MKFWSTVLKALLLLCVVLPTYGMRSETLMSELNDDTLIENYVENFLSNKEGTVPHIDTGGNPTAAYGVFDSLGLNRDDYSSDKDFAKAVVQLHINDLRSGPRAKVFDFDALPDSMKYVALDLNYNAGDILKKAPSFAKELGKGNYQVALKQSLDVLQGYDPTTNRQGIISGLAKRRAAMYNNAAQELDLPKINNVELSDAGSNRVKIDYNNKGGGDIFTFSTSSTPLHSQSKFGTYSPNEDNFITSDTVQPSFFDRATQAAGEFITEDVPEMASGAGQAIKETFKETISDPLFGERVDVKKKDTLTKIANERGISLDQLLEMNPDYRDNPDLIEVGEKVKVSQGMLPSFKEGGMTQQMDLFRDGGMRDQGGTTDPVSGNDVPIGSTKKEVRDDIPAQLSEGEFVFPADVVRYHGLEKLMELRQEAKQGLKIMEEMGQMGNSDSATIPDDIPFDVNDLVIEEETQNFQYGGFVGQPPSSATTPKQGFQQLQTTAVSYESPYAMEGPPTETTQDRKFAELVPGGAYTEMRTYRNDAGQILQIPFIEGKPMFPVPPGYYLVTTTDDIVYKPEDETKQPEQPVVTASQPDDSDDDREDDRPAAVAVFGGESVNGRLEGAKQYEISYDSSGPTAPGIFGLLTGGMDRVTLTDENGRKAIMSREMYNQLKEDRTGVKTQAILEQLFQATAEADAAIKKEGSYTEGFLGIGNNYNEINTSMAKQIYNQLGIEYKGQPLSEAMLELKEAQNAVISQVPDVKPPAEDVVPTTDTAEVKQPPTDFEPGFGPVTELRTATQEDIDILKTIKGEDVVLASELGEKGSYAFPTVGQGLTPAEMADIDRAISEGILTSGELPMVPLQEDRVPVVEETKLRSRRFKTTPTGETISLPETGVADFRVRNELADQARALGFGEADVSMSKDELDSAISDYTTRNTLVDQAKSLGLAEVSTAFTQGELQQKIDTQKEFISGESSRLGISESQFLDPDKRRAAEIEFSEAQERERQRQIELARAAELRRKQEAERQSLAKQARDLGYAGSTENVGAGELIQIIERENARVEKEASDLGISKNEYLDPDKRRAAEIERNERLARQQQENRRRAAMTQYERNREDAHKDAERQTGKKGAKAVLDSSGNPVKQTDPVTGETRKNKDGTDKVVLEESSIKKEKEDKDSDPSPGTYCCTASWNRNQMTITEIKELRRWHRQQSSMWQEGYDIWGKWVADNLVAKSDWSASVVKDVYEAFINKKYTTKGLIGLSVIIPGVYATAIYRRIRNNGRVTCTN